MKTSVPGAIAGPADRPFSPSPNMFSETGGNQGERKLNQNIRCPTAPETRRPLSGRENEVMKHLRQGLLYKEIADKMGISFTAVHKLQHKIFLKLQVSNRTEAVNKWKRGRRC